MNPRLDFRGHSVEYRHFKTDRHSGLLPHHFKRRPIDWFRILLVSTIILGAAALALFSIQVLR